jgi:hypothetical protein
MTEISKTKLEKLSSSVSKPEILAKILYGAIVRYVKAKEAQNREKKCGLALDSSRERRVNITCNDID